LENNDVFFSVIIPTYNREDILMKTIQSVLAQRFEQFELLIVDDGSTDRTADVIHSFQDGRIVYFKKENGERAAARNAGIKKAQGQYLTFLDSDDLLKENHLSTAWKCIQQDHPAVFHLGYDVVDPTGNVLSRWKRLPSPVNDKLIEGNFLSCLGVFVRREVLLECNFNEDRLLSGSEDYELWLRLASRYPVLAFPESTALLVEHETRSVALVDSSTLLRRIELLRFYLRKDIVFVNRYQNQLQRWYAFLNIYVALHLALLPDSTAKAFRYAMQALRQLPAILFEKRFWIVLKKLLLSAPKPGLSGYFAVKDFPPLRRRDAK
jgi:glycosyltransferase involved in cell wall biosynthesis